MKLVLEDNKAWFDRIEPCQLDALKHALQCIDPDHVFLKREYAARGWDLRWDGTWRFIDDRNAFSIGIAPMLQQMFNITEVEDRRVPPAPRFRTKLNLPFANWLPHQDRVFADFQKTPYGWGLLNACVNSGKTEIAARIINHLNVPTLFVIPGNAGGVKLFDQTRRRLAKLLSFKVGRLGDGIWDFRDVNVAILNTVASALARPTGKKGAQLQHWLKQHCGLFIFDECDAALGGDWKRALRGEYCSMMMRLHEACHAYYRLGMTGTLTKDNPLRIMRAKQYFGEVFSTVTTDELMDRGQSARGFVITIPYHSKKTPPAMPPGTSDAQLRESLNESLAYFDPDRNELIGEVVEAAAEVGMRSAVFTRRIPHWEQISDELRARLIPFAAVRGSSSKQEHQIDRALKQLEDGKIDCLLANNVFTRGISTQCVEVGIDATPDTDEAATVQRLGRVLRSKEAGKDNIFFFVLIRDKSHWALERSYQRKRSLLAEEGSFEFIDLETCRDLKRQLKDHFSR